MPEMMIVIVVLLVLVTVPLAILAHQRERKHWAELAASRGWQHIPVDKDFFKGLRLEPFGRGSTRRARNVVSGNYRGIPIRAFRYDYTTGSGEDSTTHRHSVVQFPSRAVFPQLEVYSGWRPRLTKDIQFESTQFNKAFDVRGPDERFAFSIVHPRFMAALMDGALGKYHLAIEDGIFTIWRKGTMKVEYVDEMLEMLIDVLQLVPPHVWTDGRVHPPAIGPRPEPPAIEPGDRRATG